MNKDRVAAIIIQGNKILLMFRINNGKEYYTFPGGGIEIGESHDDALKREILEETSIEISVGKLLYEVDWDHNSKQFFYLCFYKSGDPILGDYNEKDAMADGRQYYEPMWVDFEKLPDLIVYPLEVKDLFINDFRKKFKVQKRDLFLCLKTCRQNL